MQKVLDRGPAAHWSIRQGYLTVEDVHEGISKQNGPITYRLFAALPELPGVDFDRRLRKLYYPCE